MRLSYRMRYAKVAFSLTGRTEARFLHRPQDSAPVPLGSMMAVHKNRIAHAHAR